MAGVGPSTSNSSTGTSATSDDDHESDVLMANNTISVCINKRHKTYMQACCADGICFGKFKDIETRILEVDPQPLFSNIHINKNGVCVPSVPLTRKWSEFLFDLWNWRTHKLLEENYVTQIDVNRCGRGKLYAAWCIMDKYWGRYRRRHLTHNVVDVQIMIPDCNLFISYNFCYKYFRTSKGSPYTLLPDMLKPIMIRLYNKYFVDIVGLLDVFRMKQTKMYVCTLEEFILVEIWIHCCTCSKMKYIGKYTGFYTIATMEEKCENCS